MSKPTDRLGEAEECPWETPGSFRMDCEPHRGHHLLALGTACLACGVLSLCCFVPGVVGFPLGVIAYVTAGQDLNRMRTGILDPRGWNETRKARAFAVWGMFVTSLSWFQIPFGLRLLGIQ